MNAKPKTELNRCVFVQKRNSVNGASIPTRVSNSNDFLRLHPLFCLPLGIQSDALLVPLLLGMTLV